MKLLSFVVNGEPTWGVATDSGVVDAGTHFGAKYPTLRHVLDADAVEEVRAFAATATGGVPIGSLHLLPVIPQPDKIFCVGLNYHAHRLEAGREETAQPPIFIRVPTSQVGHGQALWRPAQESTDFDYEGEIAIVIGKEGRRISQADSWSYIAGYAPYNDGSVRDWQRHTGQWTPGKNFDCTGGFGPWMVTRDEIADGEVLTMVTRLNGEELQRTTTDLLIFSIPEIIEYLSKFCTLLPGDVIVTGTPGGVGFKRTPPIFMKPGDVCEIEVSKVGILSNFVKDA
ncbi:MAG: fumarylacetoacetate hydrolase family protein [Pseudomonadota bacterium]